VARNMMESRFVLALIVNRFTSTSAPEAPTFQWESQSGECPAGDEAPRKSGPVLHHGSGGVHSQARFNLANPSRLQASHVLEVA
jgi:hypothetical protein